MLRMDVILVILCAMMAAFSCRASNEISHLPLIPHHRRYGQRHSRHLSFENRHRLDEQFPVGVEQTGALYQGYGTHYIDLWVGTPAQRQTLIVDTGSGMTAFPCSSCNECGAGNHLDEYFQETESESFHELSCGQCSPRGRCTHHGSCQVSVTYAEGSTWTAYEAVDSVYIGGPHTHALTSDNRGVQGIDPDHAFAYRFNMTFGCQTRLKGYLFIHQLADGISGMNDMSSALWSQMYNAQLVSKKQFSLCFTRQPVADKKGTEAGAMTLGGFDARLHTSPMVYTKREQGRRDSFYSVKVRKIYLRAGGEEADSQQIIDLNVTEKDLNHGSVIVDSGTTDTYFTRRIASQFRDAYRQLTGDNYNHDAVQLTEQQLHTLPTILIQLGGDEDANQELYPNSHPVAGLAADVDPENPYDVMLAIPPSHYMEYDGGTGRYTARFYVKEAGGSVLGANAMMGHDVFFDIENSRIGWAESDCDYHALLTSQGFEDSLYDDVQSNTIEHSDGTVAVQSENNMTENISIHPAILACNDATCRGTVAILAVCVLCVGFLVGRLFQRRGRDSNYQSVADEIEIPTVSSDMDYIEEIGGDVRLQGDNEENTAAAEGSGYEDEPPTQPVQVV